MEFNANMDLGIATHLGIKTLRWSFKEKKFRKRLSQIACMLVD